MKLFNRCKHEWKVINKINILRLPEENMVGWIYIQECTKCGEIQSKKIMIKEEQ